MKKPLPFFRNMEGTIMIFSLFIILGGTLVLAAWVQMLATRATYTATTEEGQKRRIAMENGRALARQYVLNQMPNANSFLGTNYSLADGWGGFSLQVPPDNPWLTTNFSVANPFNPISDDSFVVAISGSNTYICNSAETNRWTFFVRSRSPLLAGYPLAVHNPGTTNPGTWAANTTNKIYWTNALGFSNAADVPFTSGYTASGNGTTNAYLGYFASPMNTNTSGVTILTNGFSITYDTNSTNGATYVSSTNPSTNTNMYITNYRGGNVTLVLNSTQTNSITHYDITNTTGNNTWAVFSYTNTSGSKTNVRNYSNSAITNLMLVASTNTNTLHLIATNNLATLTLNGTANSRRIYLNKNGGSMTIKTATYTGNYTWWLGMTLSNCAATVYAPTNANKLNIQGGIRSDGAINVNQGNLVLMTNSVPAIIGTNVSPIEFIADRILWLEEQKSTNQ